MSRVPFRSGHGRRVDRVIRAIAREAVDAKHYRRAGGEYDHQGEAFHPRGGFWRSSQERIASGVTKAEVKATFDELRRLGVPITLNEADLLLTHAFAATVDPEQYRRNMTDRPTWARNQSSARAKAIAEGRCSICKSPSADRIPAEGRKTCGPCVEYVAARRRARKEAAQAIPDTDDLTINPF